MKTIRILVIILAFSLPVWALKPVDDSELSRVTGLNSLTMNTPERARLALRMPVPEAYRGIGFTLQRTVKERLDDILYGGTEDMNTFLAALNAPRSTSGPKSYKDGYISTEELQYDQASGRDDPLDIYVTPSEYRYTQTEPVGAGHSIYYLNGSFNSNSGSILYQLKPYGGGEMRDYYIQNTNTVVHPNSWVDVKPR